MAHKLILRTVMPFLTAIKHIFMHPYTLKYPYERVPNLPAENYRYDPKAGIAYPGFKGRHVLYLEKCTGCSLCDLTCQNIAEAITMVYAYDISLQLDENTYSEVIRGNPAASEPMDELLTGTQNAEPVFRARNGASHPLMVIYPEMKYTKNEDGTIVIRLNQEPLWEHRSDLVVTKYLSNPMRRLASKGWETAKTIDKAPDAEAYSISKGNYSYRLTIEKRDFKLDQNKKSYFPQVDYGRCVFCGFCVDACPFYALEMSSDIELSSIARQGLVYNPLALSGKGISTPPPSTNPIDAIYGWIRLRLKQV